MRYALFLVIALLSGPARAGIIEGRVIEVPDGNTITVLSSGGSSMHRVRLAGIAAPSRNAPLGGIARENLRRVASGRQVRVDTSAMDAKGTLIGVVQVYRAPKECGNLPCDGAVDPGLSQLSSGMAAIDKTYLSHQSEEAQRRYAFAEAHARTSKVGLWRPAAPGYQARVEAR